MLSLEGKPFSAQKGRSLWSEASTMSVSIYDAIYSYKKQRRISMYTRRWGKVRLLEGKKEFWETLYERERDSYGERLV